MEVNPTKDRGMLIIAAGKYSEQEQHSIWACLCFLRDSEDIAQKEAMELMLQAFINRKRLGIPCTIQKMKREFLGRFPDFD